MARRSAGSAWVVEVSVVEAVETTPPASGLVGTGPWPGAASGAEKVLEKVSRTPVENPDFGPWMSVVGAGIEP